MIQVKVVAENCRQTNSRNFLFDLWTVARELALANQASLWWNLQRTGLVGAALVVSAGCCAPLIRSDRLVDQPSPSVAKGEEAASTEVAIPLFPDRLVGICRPLLHYLAGPFTPQETIDQYQSAVQPPHSKFHPVPTRPVFAPQPYELGPVVSIPLPNE